MNTEYRLLFYVFTYARARKIAIQDKVTCVCVHGITKQKVLLYIQVGCHKYRFFYLVDRSTETVLPIFLSLEHRGRIDYTKIPWEEYANEIHSDYVQKNASAFEVWRLSI